MVTQAALTPVSRVSERSMILIERGGHTLWVPAHALVSGDILVADPKAVILKAVESTPGN